MKINLKISRIVIVILIVCILALLVIHNKHKTIKRPDYDYIAIIYHNEMQGFDAGTQYTYYIYESKNSQNKYFYIKSKSTITIKGATENEDIDSGVLNNKNDFEKIKDDIKKDSDKNSQSVVTYTYNNNGVYENNNDIDILGKKLFE